MKLRLLKPLPWAEVGDTNTITQKDTVCFWACEYESASWKPTSECVSYAEIESVKYKAEYWMVAKTREELETTLLLLKLRQSNGGWKPNDHEYYFHVRSDWIVYCSEYTKHIIDLKYVLLWNCYRTREEAEKYAPEWKKLFDSVK